MAVRKFTFISTEGYAQEQDPADELSLGKVTLSGVSGVAIDAGTGKITNAGAATASGDALVYGQSGASLAGLSSTGNINLNGTNKVVSSAAPTAAGDLTTKSYVDSLVVTGGQIKEALWGFEQFSNPQGIRALEVFWLANQPVNGDTVTIKNGSLTRTYTFVTGSEVAATDVLIQGTVDGTMGRLATRINADAGNTQWGAVFDNHALRINTSTGGTVAIYELVTAAGVSDSRIYGTFTTANDAKVVKFGTGGVPYLDYTSTVSTTMVATDPGSGEFGFRRQQSALIDGELHFALDDNAIWAWDDDQNVWNQFSGTGAVPDATSGAGGGIKGKVTVDENYALYVTSGILRLQLGSTGGLEFLSGTPNALAVKNKSTGGLASDANGEYIFLDGASLATSASGAKVNYDTARGLDADVSGLHINLAANPGLEFSGVDGLQAKIYSSGGLQRDANGLSINNDPAGGLTSTASGEKIVLEASNPTLQVNGSNELGVKLDPARAITTGASGIGVNLETTNPALAITGNELDVKYQTLKGLGSDASGLFVKIDGSTITYDGSGQLQVAQSGEAQRVENSIAVDAAVAVGDPVYLTATGDRVAPGDTDTDAKSRIIGIARTVQGTVGQTTEVVEIGRCNGVLTGATAGTPYYLATGGGLATAAPGAGKRVIQVGVAINATDLMVRIVDYGKKA